MVLRLVRDLKVFACVCLCVSLNICLKETPPVLLLAFLSFLFKIHFERIFTCVQMLAPQSEVQPLVCVCVCGFFTSEWETLGQGRDGAGVCQNELTYLEVHWFINSCMSGVQNFSTLECSFLLSLSVCFSVTLFFTLHNCNQNHRWGLNALQYDFSIHPLSLPFVLPFALPWICCWIKISESPSVFPGLFN